MPAHNHSVSCSIDGNHYHGIPNNNNVNGDGNNFDGGSNPANKYSNTTTAGNHSHTITIGNAGKNSRHENRQPFVVVCRWKRTI